MACTCQFCGKYDPSFTDEKLDMHYWQNCPLLMSCEECGQVRSTERDSLCREVQTHCNGSDGKRCNST